MTDGSIIKEIDKLLIYLEQPLTPDEQKCGWDEKSQRSIMEYFKRIKDDFLNRRIPGRALVMYVLDGSWGIYEGERVHKCCVVGEMVNDWLKERGLF